MSNATSLLEVRNLSVEFGPLGNPWKAIDDVSFSIENGQTVALVGESGCGKSVTALSLGKLAPCPPGRYTGGEILLESHDVLSMSEKKLREIRGNKIAYIFQEPGSSLNPVMRIGSQVREAMRGGGTKRKTLELLELVKLPDPAKAYKAFPHELSGGMQQRAMIAIALAANPALLVADEPTTALDVTVQSQILELLHELQQELGMAILLITHNFALLRNMVEQINVMYAGKIVEAGPAAEILDHPRHPYTQALIAAIPRMSKQTERLSGIPGSVPSADNWPSGCRFHSRCKFSTMKCTNTEPRSKEIDAKHIISCHYWEKCV